MNYLKNIKLLYVNKFFQNLIFAYVIERLFWQLRGMTIQMVVYTEIIYAVTIIILEIPTGILADKWSRKNLIVIGALFSCLEFILIIYAHTFWQFGIAIFIAGISTAFVSGSENALLYDSLKHHCLQHSFEKILGRLRGIDFSAAIIAGLSGGFLAFRFNYEFNYWLSLISLIIALITTFFLNETTLHIAEDNRLRFSDYIKNSYVFFKHNNNVALVMISGMIIGASMIYVDEFWQIYLNELSVSIIYFGIFSALTSIAIIPGSLLSYRLKAKYSYKNILLILICLFAVLLLIIAFAPGLAGMLAIIAVGLITGITDPLVSGYLHHKIASQMRATIDSFQSLVQRIAVIIVGLGFGYFTTKISIFEGYGFIAFLCIAYLIAFLLMARKVQL